MQHLTDIASSFQNLPLSQQQLVVVGIAVVIAIILIVIGIIWMKNDKQAEQKPQATQNREISDNAELTVKTGQKVYMKNRKTGRIYVFRIGGNGHLEYAIHPCSSYAQLSYQQRAWAVEPQRLEFRDVLGFWVITFFRSEWIVKVIPDTSIATPEKKYDGGPFGDLTEKEAREMGLIE